MSNITARKGERVHIQEAMYLDKISLRAGAQIEARLKGR